MENIRDANHSIRMLFCCLSNQHHAINSVKWKSTQKTLTPTDGNKTHDNLAQVSCTLPQKTPLPGLDSSCKGKAEENNKACQDERLYVSWVVSDVNGVIAYLIYNYQIICKNHEKIPSLVSCSVRYITYYYK